MMTLDECYLTSVDRRWKKELAQAAAKVIICSPYLTSRTADAVITSAPVEHCEVYTRFSVDDFAVGSSSLRTLKNLLKKDYKVFAIDRLHAKIVLVSGRFVSIGSQNLTANGVRNREATFTSTSPEVVARVEARLEPWLAQRQLITLDMVTSLESELPRVARQFRIARDAARQVELQVRQREDRRITELQARQREEQRLRQLQEELRRSIALKRQAQASDARAAVRELLPDGKVSRELAQRFIRWSAWLLNHRSGRPVRAKRYSSQVYEIAEDQRVDFGSNTFLVGRAIKRCVQTIEEYINSFEAGQPWFHRDLINRLHLNVRGAVEISGKEYPGYYWRRMIGDHMKFNWYSIKVNNFVNLVLQDLPPAVLPEE